MTKPINTPDAIARREARDRTREFLGHQDNVDLIIERIAASEALKHICEEFQLVYSSTQVYLAEHHTDAYNAAKRVRADSAIDDLESLEGKLLGGELDFNRFREVANSMKWRAEKLNPKAYGEHQNIDMKVTDATALHLEALRKMTQITVTKEPQQTLPAPTPTELLPAPVDATFEELP